MVEINTTDEMFALLCEAGASIESLIDGVEAQRDDYFVLDKIRAVTLARSKFAEALKLRSNGNAHRDRLVAAKLDVRS